MAPAPHLRDELAALLAPDRVSTRPIDRVAWANDASVYRLLPAAVAWPSSVAEIRRLRAEAARIGLETAVAALSAARE